MKKENIGKNAGIVWRTLHDKENEMSLGALVEATRLSHTELAAAIGWLSRENKIIVKETNGEFFFTVYKECYY